jgi:hypothetical protein
MKYSSTKRSWVCRPGTPIPNLPTDKFDDGE